MTDAIAIPRRPTDVTAGWLSEVLSGEERRTVVDDVVVVPVGTGQTGATYRLAVTYGDNPGNLPDTLVIKLPVQDDALRGGLVMGYLSEVAFYDRVAHLMAVPTPRSYYADITEDGADFALLLADLAPAEQGDQIAGADEREAQLAVTALAGLHGPSWCDPTWLGLSEVAMPKPGDDDAARGMGDVAKMAVPMMLDKIGSRLDDKDRETVTAAMDLVTPWQMAEPARYALMHGDYRLDNLLYDPDRTMVTVVDWQTMGVGLPARDLAYFTATSLLPPARAALEEQLVDAYYRALLGHGVTGYDRDTCWRDYRLGMLQGPLITTFGCAFASATERGADMFVVMLQRSCQAIRELGTLELIQEIAGSTA